jgi:hypothetical protein
VSTSTVRYATKKQLISTLDSTSQFWTGLSGGDFLIGLETGAVDTSNENVQRVLRILDYVLPKKAK